MTRSPGDTRMYLYFDYSPLGALRWYVKVSRKGRRIGPSCAQVWPTEMSNPTSSPISTARWLPDSLSRARNGATFGFAGVINEISAGHEAFLNAGGLGILIGDGKLPHPGPEQIIETYYAFPLSFWRVTLDYQLIVNPAYNRDRGPVSVLGARLHSQF